MKTDVNSQFTKQEPSFEEVLIASLEDAAKKSITNLDKTLRQLLLEPTIEQGVRVYPDWENGWVEIPTWKHNLCTREYNSELEARMGYAVEVLKRGCSQLITK